MISGNCLALRRATITFLPLTRFLQFGCLGTWGIRQHRPANTSNMRSFLAILLSCVAVVASAQPLNVGPCFSPNKHVHVRLVDCELFGKLNASCQSFGERFSDFKNVFSGQLMGWVGLASIVPALPDTVLDILLLSSDKQVVGPYARGIIAVMAHPHSFWKWSISENPGCDVGVYFFGSVIGRCPDDSVSVPFVGSIPQPTAVSDDDFIPETGNEVVGKRLLCKEFSPIVGPLNQVHFGCVTLRVVRSTPGHFYNRAQ